MPRMKLAMPTNLLRMIKSRRNMRKKKKKAFNLKVDKPGRQCLAYTSNKDDQWLLFLDTKSNNNHVLFLWNKQSKLKVKLPNLPEEPEAFFKCLLSCKTTRSRLERVRHGCCIYEVFFFHKDSSSCFWCSQKLKEWEYELFSDERGHVFTDVVFFKSDDNIVNMWGVTITGNCVVLFKPGDYLVSPNRSRLYQRRFVVHYGEDRNQLFLMELRAQFEWEVYEIDASQQKMVRVTDQLEGIVVFLSGKNYSVTYPHNPDSGLVGNCIWFTEDGDHENFYVFCLTNKCISIIKKEQLHSRFPISFLNLSNPGMKLFRFDDEDVQKDAICEQVPADKDKEITMPMHSGTSSVLLNMYYELPHDIQRIVAESLHSAMDYSNFRLVCRKWREIARPICWKPDSAYMECPWLLSFNENGACTSLIDPNSNTTYYSHNPELSDCKIRYSNDGWLLVTKGTSTIFFFEPFSRTKINLPDLRVGNFVDWMSFSASPTSPNWVIIVILMISKYSTLRVVYLRSVDKKWIYGEFFNFDETFLISSPCSPVFHDGKFYYLGQNGILATFWWEGPAIRLKYTRTIDGILDVIFRKQMPYLVSCENDLYLVAMGPLGQFVNMYTMNPSYQKWNKVKALENFSLFLSRTSSTAVQITHTKNHSTINFPLFVEKHHIFYKLDASEFRCYDGDISSSEIHVRNELHTSTWIRPKVIRGYK